MYILIYAGLQAVARKGNVNKRARADSIMAGLAAAGSLLIPAVILVMANQELQPLIPAIIAVVSIGTGVRNFKERTIETSHFVGDIIGYAFALAAIALFHLT